MRVRSLVVAAVAALMLVPAVWAKSPRQSMVVNTAWLGAHLKDPNLVLLHVGDKDEYAAKHIPGARFLSLSDIAVSDRSATGLILELPPTDDDLKARLEKLGISDDSRVVVYYGKDWVSPTTRVIFTLDYAGLGDRALLLDGGMGAWMRDGHDVTDAVPAERTGKLSALKIRKLIVDADYVLANKDKKGIALVDGRAAAFYDGVDTGGSHDQPHRTGHITGAGNFPFTEVTNDELYLRSSEELRALLAKAGVQPGDTVLGYCHIGQQMTAVLFAARTLGHKVLLYDGSMQDWS
ncbi:MAG TPA: rhodanese-like domain-containing protein, partial [Thermoanaerobaculia bacterium]|nr:rhodanese-like domain-containing protein [Thermoanaerobaculia bacterium]